MNRSLINIMLGILCLVAGPAIAATQENVAGTCIRAEAAHLL